jgi:P-type Cu+ transporter
VLRAGHVAILDGGFQYFCGAECKAAFVDATSRRAALDAETSAPPIVSTTRALSITDEPPLASGRRATEPDDAAPTDAAPTTDAAPDDGAEGAAEALAAEQEPYFPTLDDAADLSPVEAAPETLRSRARADAELARVAHEREHGARVAADSAADGPPADATSGEELRPVDADDADPVARPPRDARAVVAIAGVSLGALGSVIGLAGPAAATARFALTLAAIGCVVAHGVSSRAPMLGRVARALVYAPAVVAGAAAVAAHLTRAPAATYEVHASVTAAATLVCLLLLGRASRSVETDRARVRAALDVCAARVDGQTTVEARAGELKPGEQAVVGAGETCPVDGVVAAGTADVRPWLDARATVPVGEGHPIVAGAHVVAGTIRVAATSTGDDRAWAASVGVATVESAPMIERARRVVERGAPIAAALVGVAVWATGAKWLDVLASVSAGAFAAGVAAAVGAAASVQAHARVAALGRGVVYRGAAALEDAGRVDIAVLCSRGTVLVGEPEVVGMETFGATTELEMLSLSAGAETASSHPIAAAVHRSARARKVEPDAVRSATSYPGLGVTALTPSGKRMALGSRAFLLREGVSIAAAESKIASLEARGKTVLLLAVGGKLAGLMALQDGVRRGARAAVQKMHDAHIEPVLLSGDSRQTCEATAQALDIEHIRPEVPAADRGNEVRALTDGGRLVAAIGHPPADEAALGAATVAVGMRAAGGVGEWGVQLASDDIRDASLSLTLARSARDRARLALVVGAASSVAPALVVGFGVGPAVLVPLVSAAGAVAAFVVSRAPTETI